MALQYLGGAIAMDLKDHMIGDFAAEPIASGRFVEAIQTRVRYKNWTRHAIDSGAGLQPDQRVRFGLDRRKQLLKDAASLL